MANRKRKDVLGANISLSIFKYIYASKDQAYYIQY